MADMPVHSLIAAVIVDSILFPKQGNSNSTKILMSTPVKKVTITIALLPLKSKEVFSGKKELTGSSTVLYL